EDSSAALRPTRRKGRRSAAARGSEELRFPRLHPLLGEDSPGSLDGEAQDGVRPVYPVPAELQPVESKEQARTRGLAACTDSQQAERALWVLRASRELQVSEQCASLGQEALAQVAQSPLAHVQGELGAVQPPVGALSAAQSEDLSKTHRVTNPWPEE